jgi:hypothetical protein
MELMLQTPKRLSREWPVNPALWEMCYRFVEPVLLYSRQLVDVNIAKLNRFSRGGTHFPLLPLVLSASFSWESAPVGRACPAPLPTATPLGDGKGMAPEAVE